MSEQLHENGQPVSVGSTGGSATDLLRRLEIYTLCPKCSQESRVPGSIKGTGFISNMHYCPHCGTQIDTWLRIPSLNIAGHTPEERSSGGCV